MSTNPPPSIRLKATLNTQKRRFSIPLTTTFSTLQSQLSAIFSLPPPFTLTYQDDEQDLVHISTDYELTEALRLAHRTNLSPLRLYLYHPNDTVPDHPPVTSPTQTPRQTPTATPAPFATQQQQPPQQQQQQRPSTDVPPTQNPVHALGGLLDTVIAALTTLSPSTSPLRAAHCAGRGRARRAFRGACRGNGRRGGGGSGVDMFGMLGGMFGPGTEVFGRFEALLRRLNGVGEGTMRAVESVRREMGAMDVGDMAGVGRDVWGIVGGVVREVGAGREGGEWVEEVVGRVEGVLGGVPEGVRRSVVELVRVALADEVVRGVLRDLGEMGDVETFGFVEGEGEGGEATLPRSPIRVGETGANVRALQRILTDLGYMTPEMYRWGFGIYGPNTKTAVSRFQREYGLGSAVEDGVYDATTAASLASLFESQVPPRPATGRAGSSDLQGDGAEGAATQG